jgi:hypothetical protein
VSDNGSSKRSGQVRRRKKEEMRNQRVDSVSDSSLAFGAR